jgi:Cd2+/Zn2+-exporting ATPase
MTEKLVLDLRLLLPELPKSRDGCVQRLQDLLRAEGGVGDTHVLEDRAAGPALCIHFDPERLTVSRVRELARRAGADLTDRYGHVLVTVEPMHARRARTLAEHLRRLEGVLEAEVSPDGVVRIEYERPRVDEVRIQAALNEFGAAAHEPLGAKAKVAEGKSAPEHEEEDSSHAHDHAGILGEKAELIFALIAGLLVGVGWLLETWTALPAAVALGCYLAAYFFGGFFTVREAYDSLRVGQFEIDFLMLIAAAGAAMLGAWAEGALLLFLFSLGHALEHYAMGRARRAIEALAELAPETALVRRDGETKQIRVEELAPGDIVIVKPNERIAADGFIVKGESSVNQAPVTGESVPADKRPVADPEEAARDPARLDAAHRVFAGTINQSGALEVRVTKRAGETTLARVVALVSEAETEKSPTERFTDRFERYFVPAVLGLAVLLLFAWVVIDEPFRDSFYRAMAVLVAASPCALAIATPSAVLSGLARAARGGVLVKGGGPLESLGRLAAMAFDKTGTLTEGRPRVTDVAPAEGASERELLRAAVAVERLSDHPLAAAVVRDGLARLDSEALPEALELKSITGRGVLASLDGQPVFIGKSNLFAEVEGPPLPTSVRNTVERLEQQGRTTMILRHGDRYLGVLGLMDTPREAAKQVIQRLRRIGVRRMILISGDNQRVAEAVAKDVGLDEAWGDLMPEDKVESIKKLRAQDEVAMVGDGVNDAPAMAHATVGIAMGAAGSDVALETADVALMADDLNHLPFAVGLSRKTSRIIRQNLWFSLGMVAFLVPATIVGLQIGAAVAFHEGSTLLVVFNALRLLGYREQAPTG